MEYFPGVITGVKVNNGDVAADRSAPVVCTDNDIGMGILLILIGSMLSRKKRKAQGSEL